MKKSDFFILDARDFLTEIVEPTIEQFARTPSSRRLAFLACVSTFHLLDYIEPDDDGRRRNLRNIYRRESAAFELVDRVAHAFKHAVATGRPGSELPIGHVYERPAARAGVMQCGVSRCGDSTGGVQVVGGPNVDLLPVVQQAIEFLRTKMCTAN